MSRPRVIVGIGEALLCETPERIEPGGLAVNTALEAAKLGHAGIAISRIGQDRAGDDLLGLLTKARLNTAHLQSDPDLPTGRIIVRTVAGKVAQSLTARAAFDNLQWDFDMIDAAQQADAVVFGGLARREGQSRSVIKQFLAECTGAIRVFDMTNRAGDTVDRAEARAALEFAEAAVVDAVALKALVPGWAPAVAGSPAPHAPAMNEPARELLIANRLSFVLTSHRTPQGEQFTLHNGEGSWPAASPFPTDQHEGAIVRVLAGMLGGAENARVVEELARGA
jgi:hypothetical protein